MKMDQYVNDTVYKLIQRLVASLLHMANQVKQKISDLVIEVQIPNTGDLHTLVVLFAEVTHTRGDPRRSSRY